MISPILPRRRLVGTGVEKGPMALGIPVISDQHMSKLNVTDFRQMKDLYRCFTYILLWELHKGKEWGGSVFTTSHQFMSHAGNILRIEFQVFCWVFWSRVLIHYALRGTKQSRKISLRCASLVFLRVEDVQRMGDMGRGT